MKNIPFKSKLSRYKNIKNRNKAYDKMDPEQQRREIAYDVIKSVLSGSYIPRLKSGYIGSNLRLKMYREEDPAAFQMLAIEAEPCKVCAIGGVMLSMIKLGNKFSCEDHGWNNGGAEDEKLTGFKNDDLTVLEDVFEGWDNHKHKTGLDPYNANKTIINMMLNVIVNGKFLKTDTSNYIEKFKVNLNIN